MEPGLPSFRVTLYLTLVLIRGSLEYFLDAEIATSRIWSGASEAGEKRPVPLRPSPVKSPCFRRQKLSIRWALLQNINVKPSKALFKSSSWLQTADFPPLWGCMQIWRLPFLMLQTLYESAFPQLVSFNGPH